MQWLIKELEGQGCRVFICAAGMAAHLAGAVAAKTIRPVIGVPLTASALGGMDAHLAGAVAAKTIRPVIGVPLTASALGGMDALLATVQMPPGFPVGTVALDSAGARNVAWLAAQILALEDSALAEKLHQARQKQIDGVEKAAAELESRGK